MKSKISPPFFPLRWRDLDNHTKARLHKLYQNYKAIRSVSLTYVQLDGFIFIQSSDPDVRESIVATAKLKEEPAFGLGMEKSVLSLLRKQPQNFSDGKIYDVACAIRVHLFGSSEPLRTSDLSIKHLPWLRIPPPGKSDPVFHSFKVFNSANPIWDAINIFIIMLVSHPFSDGNGRTGRVLVNAFLRDRAGFDAHIMPLSEILRCSKGIFEEMLARGHADGNYYPLTIFLVDLFEQYIKYASEIICVKDPIAIDFINSNKVNNFRERQFDLNAISPFTISWGELCEQIPSSKSIDLIQEAARKILEFGEIEYAFSLLSVFEENANRTAITFVVNSERGEELRALFREIRYSLPEIDIFELLIRTNDPVIDAKIIINISTFYLTEICDVNDALLLIYDFK
ncbi:MULTISPECIES: Fic family protein [unclassified Janthinobacterium]|uniref:Fic family protein n=1 Tax=unclassified Janthinobacterium TaxID=2610881 RepID=UPI0016231496|nr:MULTISPECIES: Fic family protein [unclassified Janthinobacterium]MBB5369459.1 hypothetical protein [Janthinobacterium sp. K2C7]MBB5382585.1 hypothetical protein [Janthinobacterium sp. K2Li3]MBB5388162.1 hypothetical protein [Janthinobacterium sp. K2E3]